MSPVSAHPEDRRPRSSTSLMELSLSPNLTQEAVIKVDSICPRVIPSAYAKEAEEQNIAWVTRFRLVDSPAAMAKVKKTHCGLLSALVYPQASSELASIGADFFAWLFLFDDKYGEGGENEEGKELIQFAPSLT